MKELFDLLVRLVTAVEKIAANGGGGFVAEKAETEKPKKTKPATDKPADPKPEEKPAPKKNPFADEEDAPSEPAVTKEQVRKVLSDYAQATNNDIALTALGKNTSNAASKMGDIKPEDYSRVFKAISALLAETKK
jgi:outer membrane biosynthesis protein TonB